MSIRIPPPMREISERCELRKWVRRKGFPKKMYFSAIDEFQEHLSQAKEGGEVENQNLAIMISCMVDEEGDLINHVLEEAEGVVSDDEAWARISIAAGWQILQFYLNEVEKGRWPDDE